MELKRQSRQPLSHRQKPAKNLPECLEKAAKEVISLSACKFERSTALPSPKVANPAKDIIYRAIEQSGLVWLLFQNWKNLYQTWS